MSNSLKMYKFRGGMWCDVKKKKKKEEEEEEGGRRRRKRKWGGGREGRKDEKEEEKRNIGFDLGLKTVILYMICFGVDWYRFLIWDQD